MTSWLFSYGFIFQVWGYCETLPINSSFVGKDCVLYLGWHLIFHLNQDTSKSGRVCWRLLIFSCPSLFLYVLTLAYCKPQAFLFTTAVCQEQPHTRDGQLLVDGHSTSAAGIALHGVLFTVIQRFSVRLNQCYPGLAPSFPVSFPLLLQLPLPKILLHSNICLRDNLGHWRGLATLHKEILTWHCLAWGQSEHSHSAKRLHE
jgi:hypothetical protein